MSKEEEYKDYIIDLQSFVVSARNEDEAKKIAINMLKTGEVTPYIDDVIEDVVDDD